MNLIVVERAERDLDPRAAFWEERQAGLGHEYLLHLREEFVRLARIAESGTHSRSWNNFHQFLTRRFSTQVFYEVDGDAVIVYAVFDCREDPDKLAAELAKR